MMEICAAAGGISPDFSDFIAGTILPLTALAGVVAALIIAISFMAGKLLNNPKLILWGKTEIVQLVISIAAVLFIGTTVNIFCLIDMGEVAAVFDADVPSGGAASSIYQAAETYLVEAAYYSHNAMSVARFHLEGYTILSYLSVFQCGLLKCFFGYSGTNTQPFGAYGSTIAALNIFFNSMLVAHVTVLSYTFLLAYVYRGFVLLFLPLGVFMRSMPFMRGFGSMLMALAMSFLLVYPLLLSILYLMGGVLVDRDTYAPDASLLTDYRNQEEHFYELGGDIGSATGYGRGVSLVAALASMVDPTNQGLARQYFGNIYFPEDHEEDELGGRPIEAIAFCAEAFIAAVFMPTVALLGTIASVSYVTRLMGEEIDLSRITRMI